MVLELQDPHNLLLYGSDGVLGPQRVRNSEDKKRRSLSLVALRYKSK